MSIGILYALRDEQVKELVALPMEDRYGYMLDEIEEELMDTQYSCDMDTVWEPLQYALCGGEWCDENRIPANIVASGELLTGELEEVITLKDSKVVQEIAAFLQENSLQEIIEDNFASLDEVITGAPKDDEYLEFLLGLGEEIAAFYQDAAEENLQVIFTLNM